MIFILHVLKTNSSIHDHPEAYLNLLNGKLKFISDVKKTTFQPMDVRMGSARHYTFNVEDSVVGSYNAVFTHRPLTYLKPHFIQLKKLHHCSLRGKDQFVLYPQYYHPTQMRFQLVSQAFFAPHIEEVQELLFKPAKTAPDVFLKNEFLFIDQYVSILKQEFPDVTSDQLVFACVDVLCSTT